jgi:hypothetical protein
MAELVGPQRHRHALGDHGGVAPEEIPDEQRCACAHDRPRISFSV